MEPHLGIPDETTWIARWKSLASGYALMPLDDYRRFVAAGVRCASSPRRAPRAGDRR
jgi:hypothetical protein